MKVTPSEHVLKLFFLSNQLVEHELDRVEREFAVDLRRSHVQTVATDEDYYPQLDHALRAEAAEMAPHYETFYALENSIRGIVAESLEGDGGEAWWDVGRIPPNIKSEAEARHQREVDTGMTPRSVDLIDYTTFGELGEIIKTNWDLFGALFSSKKAVEKVISSLNSLRGPIAHCSGLAEDEVVRLRLTVRDWFRLME
ncbi:MAG TPA: Swt1 family HEPN domain-containing protein [Acidimicrobiales bacterium]|nr:Swt1 family HEPN domain-containing protein [Acidimicrobiales bacterium]